MKTAINHNTLNKVLCTLLMLIGLYTTNAQVLDTFTPRLNETVRGDVTIIANNMLSRTATGNYNGSDGNHDFTDNVYVDIDTDDTTFNSSSANFSNPEPQLACLSMFKAYLYWAAADRENNDGTDNQPDWNYNDVKLMLPGETSYTTITADDVIYRGRDTHFSNDPYICFKDITDDVQDLTNPYGTYQVANVEAREGSLTSHPSGNTGTSGGWQIVFVYESPKLPAKNIGLFDGYAHVTNGVSGVDKDFDITFGGFQTVPNGNVKADVIIGALEGDQDLSGDRLQIRNVANTFVDISSNQRPNTNFFNSRITVGNSDFTDRIPASRNTLGFDAAVFPLSNPGNSIITNNQTSATLRLTSNQETYGLYLVGFSVDVWAPDLDPLEIMLNTGNNPVDAGGSLGLTFDVVNKGNDDAVDLTLTANLPPQIANVVANNLPDGVSYSFNPATGSLIFNFDDDIVEVDDPELNIDFELIVQDECYFLEENCDLDFELQFKADYTGVQNPNPQTTVSSSGLNDCNIGNMLPYIIEINQPDAPLWANPVGDLDRELDCNDSSGLADAQALEPTTDKCDFTLTKTSGNFVVDPNCPEAGTYTNTWTFTDACGTTIADYVQTITITAGSGFDFVEALPQDDTVECDNIPDAETLTATISCGTTNVDFDETTSPGSCPNNYTLTRTWIATDSCGNEISHTQIITVEDTTPPTFNELPLPSDETVDADSIPNAETLTASDNCGNATVEFTEVMNGSLCDASHTIVRTWTATDECGLTTELTQTITVVHPILEISIEDITDVLCNSEATGAIDINVTGGTAPYTFVWNNGATTEDLSGILAGAYNVTVTDANGCTASISATVAEPDSPLGINISKIDANTAQGCTNGEATVSVTGGTPDYTYLWSASAGNQTTATATNLPDGTHSVTVTDANGCELTQSIVIECVNTCDAEISIDNVVNVLCTGEATGSGTVSANSDANPSATFTFTWSNGQVDSGVTSSTLNNITAGVYTVSVTIDGTVCQPVEDTISITEPSNALSLSISATDELGPSTSDGTATVVATGGVEPYTYLWTPGGETTASISGLTAGDYCVTVTDANGCTENVCVTVNPGSCLNLSISGSSTPVVCNGESNGSVTSVVSGGVGPFTYAWDTLPDTTASVSNLPAGDYTVTVTDATTQCTQSTTITINEPNELSTGIAVSNILCKNESTGSLDLTVNGGTAPYTFLWSDGSTDEDLINVPDGTYSVTITDANGCTTTNQATIIEPDEVVSGSIIDQTNVDCLGNATGEVTVEGAGGISPYSYTLDGGSSQTSGTFSGLTAGDYIITVTDANGCTFDIPVTITTDDIEAPEITVPTEITLEGCSTSDITAANSVFDFSDVTSSDVQSIFDSNPNYNASDDFEIESITYIDVVISTDNCPIIVQRTFTATDTCGNTATATQTITVQDTTAPTIDTQASDLTVECDGNGNTDALNDWLNTLGGATASDDCSSITWSNDFSGSLSDECGATGSATVTFTATDGCGNTSTTSATFTIEDTTAPTIDTQASDLTVECDGNGNTDALNDWLNSQGGSATASDTCSDVTWSNDFTALSDDCGATGSATVTFTATDECGNTSTTSATFTIEDTTAPSIDTQASDLTVECDGNGNTDALNDWLNSQGGSATASDTCSDVTWSNDFSGSLSDDCGATGSATVTFTATDECGNTSTTSATFTIEDTMAPSFNETLPADITVECDSIPTAETLTGSDDCSETTITFDENQTDGACAGEFTITRTWTAIDECGNEFTHVQTISVQDTSAPTFTVPADITIECDQDASDVNLTGDVTDEGDNCASGLEATFTDTVQDGACANESIITRTWSLSDDCGNTTTLSQTITVQDSTAPTFVEDLPGDITLECDGVTDAEILTAIDNCGDATVTFEETQTDGDCPSNFTLTRVWTATDDCGNTTVHTQLITVQDTTAPTIVGDFVDTINIACDDIPDVPNLVFEDACSTNMTVDFEETSTSDGSTDDYQIFWEWTVTDDCGNAASFITTINVTVQDNVNGGTDSLCITEDLEYDLFNLLSGDYELDGEWSVSSGMASLDGSIFNPSDLLDALGDYTDADLGDYVFTYTTMGDCPTSTDVTINIHEDCVVLACMDPDSFSFSKAVTPNGDQHNEYFEVNGTDRCDFTIELQLYNRWGALIYESQNYANDWNGFVHSSSLGSAGQVPTGTYYYIVNLKNSGLKPFSGYIYVGTK